MTAEPLVLFPLDDVTSATSTRSAAPRPRRRRTTNERSAVPTTNPKPTPSPSAPSVQSGRRVEAAPPDDPGPTGARDPGRQVARLLLSPTEAAAALGISRSKLYELMRAGSVESVRIDTARRVPADALDTYVQTLRTQSSN